MVTYTAAKEMDVNAFLITSSAESIRAAFDQAVFFCSANRQLRSENQFCASSCTNAPARP